MTLSKEVKEPLLRNFYTTIYDQTWTFNDSGPDEKDRELLVHFDCVAREFHKIKDEYKVIITDITKQMGNGMADFVVSEDLTGVQKIKDYELYCHYVAGVVGDGLTRLFVEANVADPSLLKNPRLIESMGQFLQQTNIIRDVREDHDEVRHFWPKEVWSKYAQDFDHLVSSKPQDRQKALQCSSEMVLMALNKADDCLNYMAGVREQTVFNFVAIPQSMAIATLELCFQNPAIFDKNIKITKGAACQLMIDSTQDLQHVCQAFRRYAKRIKKKNNPEDPQFHDINAACNKIDRFIDDRYPNLQDEQAKADTMYLAVLVLGVLGVVAAVLVRDSCFLRSRCNADWTHRWQSSSSSWKGEPGLQVEVLAQTPEVASHMQLECSVDDASDHTVLHENMDTTCHLLITGFYRRSSSCATEPMMRPHPSNTCNIPHYVASSTP